MFLRAARFYMRCQNTEHMQSVAKREYNGDAARLYSGNNGDLDLWHVV